MLCEKAVRCCLRFAGSDSFAVQMIVYIEKDGISGAIRICSNTLLLEKDNFLKTFDNLNDGEVDFLLMPDTLYVGMETYREKIKGKKVW